MYNEVDFRTRSLESFYPMMELPGVTIFQPAKRGDIEPETTAGVDWMDFSAELKDFADTAALVEQMDLVISVDTSTAQLAGAMAKPVWVLIPTQSDFGGCWIARIRLGIRQCGCFANPNWWERLEINR